MGLTQEDKERLANFCFTFDAGDYVKGDIGTARQRYVKDFVAELDKRPAIAENYSVEQMKNYLAENMNTVKNTFPKTKEGEKPLLTKPIDDVLGFFEDKAKKGEKLYEKHDHKETPHKEEAKKKAKTTDDIKEFGRKAKMKAGDAKRAIQSGISGTDLFQSLEAQKHKFKHRKDKPEMIQLESDEVDAYRKAEKAEAGKEKHEGSVKEKASGVVRSASDKLGRTASKAKRKLSSGDEPAAKKNKNSSNAGTRYTNEELHNAYAERRYKSGYSTNLGENQRQNLESLASNISSGIGKEFSEQLLKPKNIGILQELGYEAIKNGLIDSKAELEGVAGGKSTPAEKAEALIDNFAARAVASKLKRQEKDMDPHASIPGRKGSAREL